MDKTFQYDFKTGDFVMENGSPKELEGTQALKAWIEKCLRTPLNRYLLYKNYTYGAYIEDLVIGNTYGQGFTDAELRREIENALLQNSDIKAVTNISISREHSKMYIDIKLQTTYGEEEYTYDA